MSPEDIRLLYDFNSWANRRVQEACAALSEEQFNQTIPSSFPSVRETVAHILGAEWVWLERWRGRSPVKADWDVYGADLTTQAAIRKRWAELEKQLLDFVGGQDAAALAAVHQYSSLDGKSYSQPLWQQLQHLVNHGSYHRGQVTMMLRQLGVKPVGTDLIAFYRERGAAAAR